MTTYSRTLAYSSTQSSSRTTITQNVSVGDTINLTIYAGSTSAGFPHGTSVATATNCSVTSPGYNQGQTITINNFSGSSYSINFTGSDGQKNPILYYGRIEGTVGGTSVTAPTASSITFNNPASANTTATVNLSANGSGGTLQYALAVNNNTPTNWQSSNQFTVARGSTTVYARARRSSSTNSNVVSATPPGFLTGDTAVSATSSTISFGATSASTTLSNATAGETYAVRVNNGSTNLATRVGDGAMSFTSSLPSSGSTTYEIFVRRPTSTGGDGSTFTATDDTFTVTRTNQDTTPDGYSNFTTFSNAVLSTVITSNTQTIYNITGDVSVSVSGQGSPQISVNGGAYSSSSTTIQSGQTLSVRLTSSASNSTDHVASVTVGTLTRTFTVTTVAAGSSGGTSTGGGTSDYGMIVYDTDGSTSVLSPSTRYLTAMNVPGSITIADGSSYTMSQDMTGLTTANSDIIFPGFSGTYNIVTTRLSNGFRFNNNSGASITITPILIRF